MNEGTACICNGKDMCKSCEFEYGCGYIKTEHAGRCSAACRNIVKCDEYKWDGVN